MEEKKKVEVERTKLNKEEWLTLIQVVSKINVPVDQSQRFVMLINKMSKIIDEM